MDMHSGRESVQTVGLDEEGHEHALQGIVGGPGIEHRFPEPGSDGWNAIVQQGVDMAVAADRQDELKVWREVAEHQIDLRYVQWSGQRYRIDPAWRRERNHQPPAKQDDEADTFASLDGPEIKIEREADAEPPLASNPLTEYLREQLKGVRIVIADVPEPIRAENVFIVRSQEDVADALIQVVQELCGD